MVTREQTVETADGGQMGGYLALPESGTGPGLLVLMEIYGVGSYIKRAAQRLAELGYVALAPDLYRRIAPGLALDHDEEGLKQALECVQRLDMAGAVEDSITALHALRNLPEVEGHDAGVLGFCLGGRLAYEVAAAADPALAVCYYGSGIADSLDRADQISCPALFHFGAEDNYIPLEAAHRVEAVAQQRPGWECHIQPDGGHAFDNHDAPMFSRPQAAARAWELTREFLARRLS
jgi:carboxymethylenebutenolidase